MILKFSANDSWTFIDNITEATVMLAHGGLAKTGFIAYTRNHEHLTQDVSGGECWLLNDRGQTIEKLF